MLEGLWTIEFNSNLRNFGAGVMVFESNRILGGDSSYYYTGNYKVGGDIVTTEIKVTLYSGEPYSIFGRMKNFVIKASGKIKLPVMIVAGHSVEDPNMIIIIKCTKIA